MEAYLYFLVFLLQIIQSSLKVFEIKWSYENKEWPLIILSLIMNATWIIATSVGVGAVIKGDYYMMAVYIISGGLGKLLSIRILGNYNYRNKILKKIKNEKNIQKN